MMSFFLSHSHILEHFHFVWMQWNRCGYTWMREHSASVSSIVCCLFGGEEEIRTQRNDRILFMRMYFGTTTGPLASQWHGKHARFTHTVHYVVHEIHTIWMTFIECLTHSNGMMTWREKTRHTHTHSHSVRGGFHQNDKHNSKKSITNQNPENLSTSFSAFLSPPNEDEKEMEIAKCCVWTLTNKITPTKMCTNTHVCRILNAICAKSTTVYWW